ncbi:uncharacterized protein LOC130107293 isoform X2 [Lampris incognitus]|uniref:uncharacterized protein LOC130107293 isoform X2 n=1 Tax=Lampris incognitus TaxID=2546036 RepID=UPI0024B52776|nr:uncharacterized protein LOC130107293 isoform X2 [Lampris incognitus]
MDTLHWESNQPKMDIHEKKGGTGAAVGREEPGSCTLPFGHFLYVDQVYKEEMKRIERQNRVRIVAEVKLSVEVDPRAAGDPDKALSDVINLIQKCLGDASGFSFPLKHVDRRNLEDMFRVVVQENAKLLLMLSPDEITVRGPRKSLDDVRRCLKTPQHNLVNSDPSAGLYALGSRDTSPKIAMNIKDHLVSSGLTMDKNHWKAMNAAFGGKLADIRAKFGVEFVAAATSRGHVNVKPKSAHDKEAAALECHALRALIHLYQKVATSTMSHSSLVPDHARSAARASTEEGGTAGGATAEETCPICMDTFTNKKKLKCTHEFCAECLLRSEQSMGPICPMCKSVYGKVEGNQPEGHMSVSYDQYSLPGFPNCGKITITYKIPSGVQTKKHPKPGMPYSGISRAAYLPNNTEGKEVLELLRRAFTQKLIFTVGTSRTTGAENQVTWNDIHHKTSTTGGPQSFGYPDPGYLGRVRDELKAKGVE